MSPAAFFRGAYRAQRSRERAIPGPVCIWALDSRYGALYVQHVALSLPIRLFFSGNRGRRRRSAGTERPKLDHHSDGCDWDEFIDLPASTRD
jgi:hypothetical protein